MRVVLFGATGMIGEGALIECLEDPGITAVLSLSRRPSGHTHDKLTELIHKDFADLSAVQAQLRGYDACLYCLGISSGGMSEADYRRITYDFTVEAGRALLAENPEMRMCFISGAGTDHTSRTMWARVKGEAEQALLAMPWKSAHMFRPAGIEPKKEVVSGVASYRFFYRYFGWSLSAFRLLAPHMLTDTVHLGQAMIQAARTGQAKQVLEGRDINAMRARGAEVSPAPS